MPSIAHHQVEKLLDRFVVLNFRAFRPTQGVKVIGVRSHYSKYNDYLVECDTSDIASKMIYANERSRMAWLRDVNDHFGDIDWPEARVGPASMCVEVPTAHVDLQQGGKGISYRELRKWIEQNCEGDISIISATYQRRLNFSSESDFILAQLTFA
jgi:hypothetical protein